MSERAYNFSAGPACLPDEVVKKAQSSLWDIDDTGVGVMECSHRGVAFSRIMEDAEANLRELAGIPDTHAVVFVQGGASSQFFMAPMNFLSAGMKADYLDTGVWSKKAITEAKLYGEVHVAASGAGDNYNAVPSRGEYSEAPAYVHYTSNNTIYGTQWSSMPSGLPATRIFCDASSDILSKPIDVAKHDLIYAGAQKNLGPAGVTVVIIRKDLAESGPENIPTMLQYRTHVKSGSCFNTPPTFSIYVIGEVLKWIREIGGLDAMQERNQAKAAVLYNHLEDSAMFHATAAPGSRSLMNVTFGATTAELEAAFLKAATDAGFSGLKGHRLVGGMRASIYNAFPPKGVDKFVEFMKAFEARNR